MNRRNYVRQVIALKDGSKKIIWHKKKFHKPQYLDRNAFWQLENKYIKPNSKRQKKLAAENSTTSKAA